ACKMETSGCRPDRGRPPNQAHRVVQPPRTGAIASTGPLIKDFSRNGQAADQMNFRVDCDIFRGPLDLLLYLVRKHEVEIVELPIAPITAQFLDYLSVLKELDVNAVGDFVEMASTLIEIKSRMVLPRGGEEEHQIDDPRQELVRRLLQYKQFK